MRCRPELAPGNAPVDDAQRIAQLIVERLEDGRLGEDAGLDAVADQFELSPRHIRRIVRGELGVPPIQLLLTRRLLLAKQLLTETALPMTEVAFASGFASVRRFNDAFATRYRMTPSRLRTKAIDGAAIAEDQTSTLKLAYRPPFDWTSILAFLAARALTGIEHVTNDSYARTVQIGQAKGWIRVTRSKRQHVLHLEFTHTLTPVLPALLARVRALFDLDARPDVIARRLARDARVAGLVKANPGLRVPGAFSGFEIALRAVIGQQVSVKAATTVAGRLGAAFGEPIVTPLPELTRLTPSAARLARAGAGDIARHGVLGSRAAAIVALARAQESGELRLDGGAHHDPAESIARLAQLPGIGPWTAHYVAMRAMRWPDAFPKEDLVVRRMLGGVTAKEADELSQQWRPWRSYAVMHLWRRAAGSASTGESK